MRAGAPPRARLGRTGPAPGRSGRSPAWPGRHRRRSRARSSRAPPPRRTGPDGRVRRRGTPRRSTRALRRPCADGARIPRGTNARPPPDRLPSPRCDRRTPAPPIATWPNRISRPALPTHGALTGSNEVTGHRVEARFVHQDDVSDESIAPELGHRRFERRPSLGGRRRPEQLGRQASRSSRPSRATDLRCAAHAPRRGSPLPSPHRNGTGSIPPARVPPTRRSAPRVAARFELGFRCASSARRSSLVNPSGSAIIRTSPRSILAIHSIDR